jgi:hypothetical protein
MAPIVTAPFRNRGTIAGAPFFLRFAPTTETYHGRRATLATIVTTMITPMTTSETMCGT